MTFRKSSGVRGFTLLELMISMSVFLVLSGAVLSSMIQLQQSRRKTEIRSDLEDRVRAAAEMVIHDVSQAGRMPSLNVVLFTASQSSTTLSGSAGVTGLYLGESVWIDPAGSPEYVVICSIASNSIVVNDPAVTNSSCSSPALQTASRAGTFPVLPAGVLAEGVLPPTPYRTGLQSSSSQLFLLGAIESDALELVLYQCSTGAPYGALTRTVWTVTQGVTSTTPSVQTSTLLDQVVCSFSYPATAANACTPGLKDVNNVLEYLLCPVATGTTTTAVSRTVVPFVNFNVTAYSDTNEPGTNSTYQLNKSYMNIQPRNLNAVANLPAAQRQDSPQAGSTILGATSLP